jgi:hypothetical protein
MQKGRLAKKQKSILTKQPPETVGTVVDSA